MENHILLYTRVNLLAVTYLLLSLKNFWRGLGCLIRCNFVFQECLIGINRVLKVICSHKFLGQEILIKIRISTESLLQGDWTAAPLIKSKRGELWLPWLTCGSTFSSVSLIEGKNCLYCLISICLYIWCSITALNWFCLMWRAVLKSWPSWCHCWWQVNVVGK